LTVKKFIISFFITIVCFHLSAQDKDIIQFTGVVFTEDSTNVIPGVHIYVPKAGRGTTTNPYGFFSMPVLEGDSIVFSSVGFERSYFIVPGHDAEHSLKKIVYLKEDVKYLREVEVFPFPSEATFKAAVLASELPNRRDLDNLNEWLRATSEIDYYTDVPSSPNENYRYFMRQQMDYQMYRYGPQQNPLLNPFAWASFIRSLRNGN
jgi:hypothetical protein